MLLEKTCVSERRQTAHRDEGERLGWSLLGGSWDLATTSNWACILGALGATLNREPCSLWGVL